jgi:hypothetical protein
MQLLYPEVEHGKIPHSALSLSSLGSEHNVLRLFPQSDEAQIVTMNRHAKGYAPILSDSYLRVIRIINPIDSRTDINRHRISGSPILQMSNSLLKGPVYIRDSRNSLRVNHDMKGVEALPQSHCGQKSPPQQKVSHDSLVFSLFPYR